jgi:hypothetical protein
MESPIAVAPTKLDPDLQVLKVSGKGLPLTVL